MRRGLQAVLLLLFFAVTGVQAEEQSAAKNESEKSGDEKEIKTEADSKLNLEAGPEAVDDDGEIMVTATRIVRKKTTGEVVPVDMSSDASVTQSVGRVVQPASWSGNSFSVVTAENMTETGANTVAEALSYTPGVDVGAQGQPGNVTNISIRGAGASQTAVLIDGVRINNIVGGGGSGTCNLENVAPSGLSRMTVLRGSQSVLYGSQAMGGALDMQIKKGSGKPAFKLAQEVGGGEHMLYRSKGSAEGGNDKFNFFVAGEWAETRGLGSSTETYLSGNHNGINEADGFTHPAFVSRLGITPKDFIEVSLISNYSYLKSSIDSGFPVSDDPNPYFTDQEIFIRPKLWLSTFSNSWDHEFGFAYIDSQQTTTNHTDDTDSHYNGRSYQFDYKSTFKALDWNTLVGGVEYRIDRADVYGYYFGDVSVDKDQVGQLDIYLQDQIRLFDEWWVTNVGGRFVDNDIAGSEVVWHVDTAVNIKPTNTTLKASAGSGFRAPTLYELYCPPNGMGAMGNSDLKPERSLTWDVGFEQDVLAFWKEDVLSFGATYYYNYFTDMIDFVSGPPPFFMPSEGFKNVGKAETYGVELSAVLNITDNFTLLGGYTNLNTKNLDSEDDNYGNNLARRPWNKFYLNANLKLFEDKLNLNGGLVYNGRSWNDDANKQSVNDYLELNAGASYQINKNFRIYGKLNNLLAQNCVSMNGYKSPGINGYAGLEVSF